MRFGLFTLIIIQVVAASGLAVEATAEPLPGELDLTQAVLVVSAAEPIHVRAAEMLQDEVLKRTGIRIATSATIPNAKAPAIILGAVDSLRASLPAGIEVPEKAEGYAVWVDLDEREAPSVFAVGRDDRGTLFAAGRLLRLLRMGKSRLTLDRATRIATAPQYAHRGHELGYRYWSNTYDAWDVNQYEQYLRDLIVFGVNTFMLTPRGKPYKESPHMELDTWEMSAELTGLIDSYGLDSWLYIPLLEDITSEEGERESLEQRRILFEKCPAITAVFVPGGDPGNTPPDLLLPWLEKLATVLKEVHPNTQLWLSNEDMAHEWNNSLLAYLEDEQPDWLTGIVYGTWTKLTLESERARVPDRYPIIQYVDITHCIESQYPVPWWDSAFAYTLGREPINPRPLAYAHIHNRYAPLTEGSIGYSDGVNDDLNKIVWAAVGWDPGVDVKEVLRDYGRYFVGEEHGDSVAKGLLALEGNWKGPLLENESIEATLAQWKAIEKSADSGNWRLQAALFRAYYDAYIRQKLVRETELEQRAYAELQRASEVGVTTAVEAARRTLAEIDADAAVTKLGRRVLELGDGLFESIGMQLSVPRHQANFWERGAVLDFLDRPLNNRLWLESEFALMLAMKNEADQIHRIQTVLNWENPGAGGFYDDLGNAQKQPHLVRYDTWAEDPGYVDSVQGEYIEIEGREAWRLSWLDQAETLYGEPLRMRYAGLDPQENYRLRILYAGRFRPTLRLVADQRYKIHGPLPQPGQAKVIDALKLEYASTNVSAPAFPQHVEFDVPIEATRDGVLELEWQLLTGRGIQVAEVWLYPKKP